MSEKEIREDERQACWEDIMHVLEQARDDTPPETTGKDALRVLASTIYQEGWKRFGSGDGKPQHKRKGSFVERRTRQ